MGTRDYITGEKIGRCWECGGHGCEVCGDYPEEPCGRCGGSGRVPMPSMSGPMSGAVDQIACAECDGEGVAASETDGDR